MSKPLFDRLNHAINKYESGAYNEDDFHSTLQSIIQFITEHELNPLRVFLLDMEADLELIDFTVDNSLKRDRYLKTIEKMKEYIGHTL
jgi:hypothetical protein